MNNELVLSKQEKEMVKTLQNNHERIHSLVLNKKYLNDFSNLLDIKLDTVNTASNKENMKKKSKITDKDLFKEIKKLGSIVQDIQVSIEDLEEGLFYKTVMRVN